MFNVVGYTFMRNSNNNISVPIKIGENFQVNSYKEAVSLLEKTKVKVPTISGYIFTLIEVK